MSIICIKKTEKNIQLASEGLVIDGHTWEIMESDRVKLFPLDEKVFVGGVGTSLTIQMFVEYCMTKESLPTTEVGWCAYLTSFKKWTKEIFDRDLDKDDTDFVVVNQFGQIFMCTCGEGIRAVELKKDNFALGIGADYAKGAMDFGASAEEACRAAAKRFIGVNSEISSFTVNIETC